MQVGEDNAHECDRIRWIGGDNDIAADLLTGRDHAREIRDDLMIELDHVGGCAVRNEIGDDVVARARAEQPAGVGLAV